jgi:hypothetical protein
MAGFVYLMRLGEHHKIGASLDPAQRLKHLSVGGKVPTLIHVIRSEDHYTVENALHRQFKASRVKGEWFALSEADVALIMTVSVCNSVGDLPEGLRPRPKRGEKRGVVGVYVELPNAVMDAMKALAERNDRTFRAELASAMRRHLAQPPILVQGGD